LNGFCPVVADSAIAFQSTTISARTSAGVAHTAMTTAAPVTARRGHHQ